MPTPSAITGRVATFTPSPSFAMIASHRTRGLIIQGQHDCERDAIRDLEPPTQTSKASDPVNQQQHLHFGLLDNDRSSPPRCRHCRPQARTACHRCLCSAANFSAAWHHRARASLALWSDRNSHHRHHPSNQCCEIRRQGPVVPHCMHCSDRVTDRGPFLGCRRFAACNHFLPCR